MTYQNKIDIFATLDYIGIDADGNIHIILKKKNKRIIESLVKILKELEDKEVFIRFNQGYWE